MKDESEFMSFIYHLSSFIFSPGPVAQWQSSALIRRWLLVRIQPGPFLLRIYDFGFQIF